MGTLYQCKLRCNVLQSLLTMPLLLIPTLVSIGMPLLPIPPLVFLSIGMPLLLIPALVFLRVSIGEAVYILKEQPNVLMPFKFGLLASLNDHLITCGSASTSLWV